MRQAAPKARSSCSSSRATWARPPSHPGPDRRLAPDMSGFENRPSGRNSNNEGRNPPMRSPRAYRQLFHPWRPEAVGLEPAPKPPRPPPLPHRHVPTFPRGPERGFDAGDNVQAVFGQVGAVVDRRDEGVPLAGEAATGDPIEFSTGCRRSPYLRRGQRWELHATGRAASGAAKRNLTLTDAAQMATWSRATACLSVAGSFLSVSFWPFSGLCPPSLKTTWVGERL